MRIKRNWVVLIVVLILVDLLIIPGCSVKNRINSVSTSETLLPVNSVSPSIMLTPPLDIQTSTTSQGTPPILSNESTTNITPTITLTPVPLGVFALFFYPPLILNYDSSIWEDMSNYSDTNTVVNYLKARNLSKCILGPEGPNGDFPNPNEIVLLGKIKYQFSYFLNNEQATISSLYILDPSQSLSGYDSVNGLPKLNVIASQSEWDQCTSLAEIVLSTLYSSQKQ